MPDPHSVDENRVVQHPKRQPPDGHSRREGLYHINAPKCDHLWPSVAGGICPSQHCTLEIPKDMAMGQSSRVVFQVCNGF